MINLLTEIRVRQAKPAEKGSKLLDGGGLYLLVTPQGQKWWRLKYRFDAKEKLLSLGVYPGIGLKQARERRDDARRQIGSGIDPSTGRHAVKASQTAADNGESKDSFEAVARRVVREVLFKLGP
jgi:Arm DNA-binding domain